MIGVPPQYEGAKFEDFDRDIEAALQTWCSQPQGVLTILGPVGTGKTRALYAIHRELYRSHRVSLWPAPKLMQRLKMLMNQTERYNDLLNELCGKEPQSESARESRRWGCGDTSIQVLLLDDLGAEQHTDYSLATLNHIISERQAWEDALVVSANLTLDEIDARMGSRTASRLSGGIVLELKGKDRRQK